MVHVLSTVVLRSLMVLPVAPGELVTQSTGCPEQPWVGVEKSSLILLSLSSHHVSPGFHFLAALAVLVKGKDGITERGECIISYSLKYFRNLIQSLSVRLFSQPTLELNCNGLKSCQLFPTLFIHVFARAKQLMGRLLSQF